MVVTKIIFRSLRVLCLALFLGLFMSAGVSAASVKIESAATYIIDDTERIDVELIVNVKDWQSDAEIFEVGLPGADIADLKVSYQDGVELDYEFDLGKSKLTIPISWAADQWRDWSLSVEYQSNMGQDLGVSSIIQFNSVDYGSYDLLSDSVTIIKGAESPDLKILGPKPTSTSLAAGAKLYNWKSDKSLGYSVGVATGDYSVAKLELTRELTNSSWWWKTATLVLPPDTSIQKASLRKLDPKPDGLSLDPDGNIIASYRLRPRQTIEAKVVVEAEVSNSNLLLSSSSTIGEIPSEVAAKFTWLDEVWSGESAGDDKSGQQLLRTLQLAYDEAVSTSYSDKNQFDTSLVRSDRLIGDLRSMGVPARRVVGFVYPSTNLSPADAEPRAWLEVYFPEKGWVTVDPSTSMNAGTLGGADVRRVAIGLSGIKRNSPGEILDSWSVNYTNSKNLSHGSTSPRISATKFVVLPGLALSSVSVDLPDGQIVDNANFRLDGSEDLALGSLAPFQTATTRSFSFGRDSFSRSSVEYGVLSQGEFVGGAQALDLKFNYVPLAIMSVLLSAGLFTIVVTGRSSKKRAAVIMQGANNDNQTPHWMTESDIANDSAETVGGPVVRSSAVEQDEIKQQESLVSPAITRSKRVVGVKSAPTSRVPAKSRAVRTRRSRDASSRRLIQ